LLKDVNFDGFKDILLRNYTVDKTYKYWLWNKEQSKYIANNEMEEIINPSFDLENKMIVSTPGFDFLTTQFTRIYKFINDKPTLVKETKSVVTPDEKNVHITVTERINNQMKITKEYDEPNEINVLIKEKLHPSMLDSEFKVYGKRKISGHSLHIYFGADKIAVYKHSGKELIQEITFGETRTSNSKSLGFVLEDMNFDGYKDIRIQQSTPPGPNIPYYCWLWDNKSSQFVENEHLEEITSPQFDQKDKIIKSFVRASAMHHLELTYQYVNKIPTIVKIRESKGELVDGIQMVHYITKELKDGKMQVVEEYSKTYDGE
jgi:hypothetical protein